MKKIAICFYGQPRRYKEVLEQWQTIIKETNADVFIHTWNGTDRTGKQIDINQLIEDFEDLNIKEMQISNPHRFLNLIPKNYSYENSSYHVMQRTYSSNLSFNIINEYSKNFKVDYGVIIETRLDLKIHFLDNFIDFIKNIKEDDSNLYVCNNHWQGHTVFDDAWMVGNFKYISQLWLNSFNYTIDFINKSSIIPGNEHNLTRYTIDSKLYQNIKRVEQLNYELLSMPMSKDFIMNQNI